LRLGTRTVLRRLVAKMGSIVLHIRRRRDEDVETEKTLIAALKENVVAKNFRGKL
jgi:hypothetical protein